MTNNEVVSLREYFERIMSEKDKALDAALTAAKEAVNVAETATERWMQNTNEWRGALSDRDLRFLTIAEFTSYRESTQRVLKEFADFKEARSGTLSDIEALNKDVRALISFKDSMDGKASQKNLTTVTILSFVSLAIGVIGVIMRLIGM
jgi:hypothetical protein